ncbi:hypothetical protein FA13DRAFT_1715773 [Coprinellus micaceus]|uniref:Uncharacterized protein n=1 Tax=Coprinellus micaceus TaxID=71717 RepID=A0A4Y7SLQ2_COPMI|nr:hypothetical protein FA13DRAFT_1715773 [Coprinellus micaceus]
MSRRPREKLPATKSTLKITQDRPIPHETRQSPLLTKENTVPPPPKSNPLPFLVHRNAQATPWIGEPLNNFRLLSALLGYHQTRAVEERTEGKRKTERDKEEGGGEMKGMGGRTWKREKGQKLRVSGQGEEKERRGGREGNTKNGGARPVPKGAGRQHREEGEIGGRSDSGKLGGNGREQDGNKKIQSADKATGVRMGWKGRRGGEQESGEGAGANMRIKGTKQRRGGEAKTKDGGARPVLNGNRQLSAGPFPRMPNIRWETWRKREKTEVKTWTRRDL